MTGKASSPQRPPHPHHPLRAGGVGPRKPRSRAAPIGRVFRCGLAGPGTLRPRVPKRRYPPAPLPASPAHPNKRPRQAGRGPRRGVGRAGALSGARGRRGGGAHLRGGRGLRTRPGGPPAGRAALAGGGLAAPAGRPGRFRAGKDRPREREEAAAAAAARGRERAGGGAAAAASRRKEEARTRAPPATRGTCCASRARASRTQPPPCSFVGGSALQATRPARPPGEHVRVPP